MKYYFDYAATTPCELKVVEKMNEYWLSKFGNASSRSHKYGWESEKALEESRQIIADYLKVEPNEIFFTSGATESNNLAIQGFVKGPSYNKNKLCCLITEHKCTIETFRELARKGYPVEFINVDKNGLLDLNYLQSIIHDISLLSVSYVNNETGVIQDIESISKICRENNVILHVDAAQAYGKIEINARLIDLLSISGHKIYGPKGIGVLFISKKPRVRIIPIIFGGGQERGIRSGTVATPLCVGLAKATEIAIEKQKDDYINAKLMQNKILEELQMVEEIRINGSVNNKIPHIINLSIPFIEGESLMMRLNKFALSSGSACSSKTLQPSYVIQAMHPGEEDLAHSSLRICYGRFVTQESINELIFELKKHIVELRKISPLWSMYKKGINLKEIKWKK